MDIEVVLAMPNRRYLVQLSVPPGTTARQAVSLALEQGFITGPIDIDPMLAPLGIYGEHIDDAHVPELHDRIEIYRPLQQDPKELRRQRAKSS